MEKKERAELIAALVTDRFSGFKDGDEAILESASDVRLEEFRSASDRRRTESSERTNLETEHRNTSARLTVAMERIKVLEAPLSEEDFRARAPEKIKTLLDAKQAEEDAVRASMISQLKDLGAHTEDELKAKTTDQLRELATYARIDVRVPDFSGRGVPQERSASAKSYAPPDPYAAGLKTLRENSTKH